jgi:actin-related protein
MHLNWGICLFRPYRTLGQEAEKAQKKQAREKDEEERRQKQAREIVVLELFKPHQTTLRFFEEAEYLCVYPHNPALAQPGDTEIATEFW